MKRINGVIIILILLLTAYTSAAQTEGSFIRVFDSRGSKIYKGHLCALTDSSLFLQKGKDTIEVFATKTATLKLRRSFGSTVLVSTAGTAMVFGGWLGLVGATSNGEPSDYFDFIPRYNFGYGALEGLTFGTIIGGSFGSIIGIVRKRPVVKINNSLEKWKKAKEFLKSYLPK